jgi:hypothetical protein
MPLSEVTIMPTRFVLAAVVVVFAACLGGPRRARVLPAVPVEGAARDL